MDRFTGAPLAGRAAERLAVGQLIATLAAGHGNLCWLQGEQGIGKNSLIGAELPRAAELGCQTLHVTPDQLICAALPGRVRGDPTAEHALAAAERVLDLVRGRHGESPVVLALASMDRASEAGLLLWKLLARLAGDTPLLLIAAARPVPGRTALAGLRDLTEQRGGTIIELGPLDPASADQLAGSIVGGAPGPRLREALGRAGGNPLYLRELATSYLADGIVEVRRAVAELRAPAPAVPPALTAVIEERLRGFHHASPASLRVAAALGAEFRAEEWAIASGHGAVEVAEAVQTAAADRLLRADGNLLRFRHAVIREVLIGQVPPEDRPALHEQIARKLADGGCGVAAVARQLGDVPGPLADWALNWLAVQREPFLDAAPLAAASMLERAVADSSGQPRQETLAVQLARVQSWLGNAQRVSEVSASIARWTGGLPAAEVRLHALASASQAGRPELAAWALAGQPGDHRLPAPWRARLTAWSAVLRHCSSQHCSSQHEAGQHEAGQEEAGQPGGAASLAGRAAALAEESGEPVALAHARYAQAVCGRAQTRAALLDDALAALPGPDPESERLRAIVLASRITTAADTGERDAGEAALRDGLQFATRAGNTRALPILVAAADWNYRHGRWDDALDCLALLDLALGGARDDGSRPPGAQDGLAAAIALRRGDRAAADALLHAGVPGAVYLLDEALAVRAEADGEASAAASIMARWLPTAHGQFPRDLRYLVYLALAAGDTRTARAAASLSEAEAAADGAPGRVITARFCQALVSDDAPGLLALAADCQGYGWAPLRASALEEAAVRLAAAGQAVPARAALTDAAGGYADLGATWDLRRADARLKAYGVRRGPNSIRRRPATGWAALTPKELDVARLAAEGRSNADIAARLFLSPRTVQAHVSKILSKLELSSRVEIVRVAAEHPPG